MARERRTARAVAIRHDEDCPTSCRRGSLEALVLLHPCDCPVLLQPWPHPRRKGRRGADHGTHQCSPCSSPPPEPAHILRSEQARVCGARRRIVFSGRVVQPGNARPHTQHVGARIDVALEGRAVNSDEAIHRRPTRLMSHLTRRFPPSGDSSNLMGVVFNSGHLTHFSA
eukprot:6999261-Prymnesium_polylepis.1